MKTNIGIGNKIRFKSTTLYILLKLLRKCLLICQEIQVIVSFLYPIVNATSSIICDSVIKIGYKVASMYRRRMLKVYNLRLIFIKLSTNVS